MARYTGPKVRISRRLGINVYENEKGRKALDRRPFPPGAHGLILVNGKRVNIPSYRVRRGETISLSEKARGMIVIQHNLDVLDRSVVGWLEVGDGGKQVTVRDLPQREHIDVPVRESLIVELYSK